VTRFFLLDCCALNLQLNLISSVSFSMDLEHIMPLAMIFSWVYTVAMLVQHIVYEKEQRLKEVPSVVAQSDKTLRL